MLAESVEWQKRRPIHSQRVIFKVFLRKHVTYILEIEK